MRFADDIIPLMVWFALSVAFAILAAWQIHLVLFPSLLLALNASAFVLYGLDKLFAIARMRRVPERVLYLATFIGGPIGALAGMWIFRHKTRKVAFQLVIAVLILAQVGLLTWWLNRL